MLVRLRRDGLNVALPSIQLGLIAFILHVGPRSQVSLIAMVLLLACGLYGWLRTLQHARLILDTPTSKVGSAAQGYVELRGHGEPLAGTPLLSPLTGLPVIWYRLATYRRNSERKWVHAHTEESDASFLLQDATGVCAVDPEGAEMLVRREDTMERGDIRQVQWCLLRHDPIYVLGDFHTLGSITPELDMAAQVRDLLAEWKRDHKRLLARFDLDGDGQISLKEWELARAQAKREVAKQRQEVLAAPEAHVVRKPDDGRLYLISDLDPARIARRYRWWSALHLSVFLGSAAAVAWLSQA
jgi:hypothetical protein